MNEDVGMARVSVRVDVAKAVPGGIFTVDVATDNGTATAGAADDYIALPSQTLTFAGDANGETQTFMVTINEDTVAEGAETFMVLLSGLQVTTTATVGLPVAATVTIIDNDRAALTMEGVQVTEGNDTDTDTDTIVAPVTVSLDNEVQGGFVVEVATADGTAEAGTDYTALTGHTLTFAGNAGEVQTFMIDITADSVPENAETLTVSLPRLQGTSAVVELPAAATVIIIDDDNNAVLTMENVEVPEGGGTASIIVSVDNVILAGFTVNALIADDTATAGLDNDYYIALTSQTLIFAGDPNEFQTFMVTINDDDVAEGTETFIASLISLEVTSGDTDLTVGLPVPATVTIVDDDRAALTMVDVTVNEADDTARVIVSLDNAVQDGFTVNAVITDDTTTAGTDYTADSSQLLTFSGDAGESRTITITIEEDDVAEGAETFMVSLSSLILTRVGTNLMVDLPVAATVTIADDDNAALTLSMASDTVNEGGARPWSP